MCTKPLMQQKRGLRTVQLSINSGLAARSHATPPAVRRRDGDAKPKSIDSSCTVCIARRHSAIFVAHVG